MNEWYATGVAVLLIGAMFLAQACGYIKIKQKNTKEMIAGNMYATIVLYDATDKDNDWQSDAKAVLDRAISAIEFALLCDDKIELSDIIDIARSNLPPSVAINDDVFKGLKALISTNAPVVEPTAKLDAYLKNLEEINDIFKLVLERLEG